MEEKHWGKKISHAISSHKSDALGICQLPAELMFLQINSFSVSFMLELHCNSPVSSFAIISRASRKKMSKNFTEYCSEYYVQELTLRM